MPLGGVAFGAMATRFGPAPAFVAGGLAILVVGVLLALVLARGTPQRTPPSRMGPASQDQAG